MKFGTDSPDVFVDLGKALEGVAGLLWRSESTLLAMVD